ncbi:MAG: hypothetical protein R8G66_01390 [Cytophagales bacterium]|nr:hypothetical protein [Cytophagales bacterium]
MTSNSHHKLILISAMGGDLAVKSISLPRPCGIAYRAPYLVLGVSKGILVMKHVPGENEPFLLPIRLHFTGSVNTHELVL